MNNGVVSIRMVPSDKYVGLGKLLESGRIKDSFDIVVPVNSKKKLSNKNARLSEEFLTEMAFYKNKTGYIIIREHEKTEFLNKLLKEEYQDCIVVNYSNEESFGFSPQAMAIKPPCLTFVLIKNYWRASQTLIKTHLLAFFDYHYSSPDKGVVAAIEQSAGRLCGNEDHNAVLYTNKAVITEIVNKSFTGRRQLDRKMKTATIKNYFDRSSEVYYDPNVVKYGNSSDNNKEFLAYISSKFPDLDKKSRNVVEVARFKDKGYQSTDPGFYKTAADFINGELNISIEEVLEKLNTTEYSKSFTAMEEDDTHNFWITRYGPFVKAYKTMRKEEPEVTVVSRVHSQGLFCK